MRAEHVIRATRDPKPEQSPTRRCGCGCGLPVIPPNIYGAKGCANRGRQRHYLQKKHKPKSKSQNPGYLFVGSKKAKAAECPDSWWILPMTRAAFMIEARRRHPEATS